MGLLVGCESTTNSEPNARVAFWCPWPDLEVRNGILAVYMLHVEIVLKTKQPEAETSLVYDVFIRVIKKESASWTSDERKRNEINMWSKWSVTMFYGLFVDSWNKGNIHMARVSSFQRSAYANSRTSLYLHVLAILVAKCRKSKDVRPGEKSE